MGLKGLRTSWWRDHLRVCVIIWRQSCASSTAPTFTAHLRQGSTIALATWTSIEKSPSESSLTLSNHVEVSSYAISEVSNRALVASLKYCQRREHPRRYSMVRRRGTWSSSVRRYRGSSWQRREGHSVSVPHCRWSIFLFGPALCFTDNGPHGWHSLLDFRFQETSFPKYSVGGKL